MKKDLCRSLSSSARRQYTTYWRRFSRFTTDILQTSPLPSTSYSVALYVTHLAKTKLKSTTTRSHLSAIAYYHKVHGFDNPSNSFLRSKLLLSHKKRDGPISERRPITISILRQLLSALNSSEYSSHKRKLFRAVFTIMYHAACERVRYALLPRLDTHSRNHKLILFPQPVARPSNSSFNHINTVKASHAHSSSMHLGRRPVQWWLTNPTRALTLAPLVLHSWTKITHLLLDSCWPTLYMDYLHVFISNRTYTIPTPSALDRLPTWRSRGSLILKLPCWASGS